MKTILKTRLMLSLTGIFFLLLPATFNARSQCVYNLNVDNGLPTNYVYSLLSDKYGYLWIATKKGVIKYNGYEAMLFNYSTGLPQEDVWRLYEDKKRRIWLSGISRQIGYIHNNRYKSVINLTQKNLYPHEIRDNGNGIFFFSPYQDENRHEQVLYMEKDDTLYCKILQNATDQSIIKDKNTILVTRNDSIYLLYPDFNVHNKAYLKTVVFLRKYRLPPNTKIILLGNYILFIKKNEPLIHAVNLYDTTDSFIDLPKVTGVKENVQMLFSSDDNYYGKNTPMLISDKNVYCLDTALKLEKVASLSAITGQKDAVATSFYIQNDLWNKCLSTFGKGVYINYPFYNNLKKLPGANPLENYIYIGRTPGENSYWWNNSTHTLAQVQKNNHIKYRRYDSISYVEDITTYNKDFSLLVSRNVICLLNNHTLQLTNFLNRFTQIVEGKVKLDKASGWDAFRIIFYGPDNFYLLSKARGLCRFVFNKDSLTVSVLNKDRFNDITYDSVQHAVWLYNADDIGIYKGGSKKYSMTPEVIKLLGIKNIEKIITDKYGNVFLKEYNRLLLFNEGIYRRNTLFGNYMLDGASISIYKHTLILAGKFGILFCKVMGPLSVSKEIVYHNIKNTSYNYIRDMQVANGKVLLNTDKGLYEVNIPTGNDFNTHPRDKAIEFKLVFFYKDTLHAVTSGEVINMDQKDMNLQFDAINPAGNGKVKYQYLIKGIDSDWHESNTSNILLSQLIPGKTYMLQVKVHDDIVNSSIVSLRLYIIPYWWQRPIWENVFLFSGFILLVIFGYSIAYITRKKVIKNNSKRNMLLELELKAVYSQINPHFIYNTLSSALLLINNKNMEQAYAHVSKFSSLLRAYVKSSRNKYITVEDEIGNLRNYIELQQTRFKNKFHYEIKMPGSDEIRHIKIPSLLLQPFVENAINHGLTPKEDTGNLIIEFKKISENELNCVIEDDGVGRKVSSSSKGNKLTESYGDQLIKDLVRIFNTYEKMHIEIQYIDKREPLTGTIVEIRIKSL